MQISAQHQDPKVASKDALLSLTDLRHLGFLFQEKWATTLCQSHRKPYQTIINGNTVIPDKIYTFIWRHFWIFHCPLFFLSERHGHVQWRFLWCAIPKLYDSWPFKRQHRPLQQWARQMLNQATNLRPAQQWKVYLEVLVPALQPEYTSIYIYIFYI